MDYRDYFSRVHEGTHRRLPLRPPSTATTTSLHGLEAAEGVLRRRLPGDRGRHELVGAAPGDDGLRREPALAEYHVLADLWTAGEGHPMFWNGLLVDRRGSSGRTARGAPSRRPGRNSSPRRRFPDLRRCAVSLVVLDAEGDPAQLSHAIAAGQGQTWPNVEVVVADATDGPGGALADDGRADVRRPRGCLRQLSGAAQRRGRAECRLSRPCALQQSERTPQRYSAHSKASMLQQTLTGWSHATVRMSWWRTGSACPRLPRQGRERGSKRWGAGYGISTKTGRSGRSTRRMPVARPTWS